MADRLTKRKRRKLMQSIRTKNTTPERVAEELFTELAVSFNQNDSSLPGTPDFFFPDLSVAVFVHGCFWHGHKDCRKGTKRPKANARFWSEKIEENKRRDRRKARQLRKSGVSVFTVWECDLKKRRIPSRLISRLTGSS